MPRHDGPPGLPLHTCADGRCVARTRAGRCSVGWGGVGFTYRDKVGTPDGLTNIRLKSGGAGKGKIGVKGGGANLHLPMLPLTTPVRVQLRRTDSNGCWDATYSTAVTNTVSEDKARS